jgi:hypothetical protein
MKTSDAPKPGAPPGKPAKQQTFHPIEMHPKRSLRHDERVQSCSPTLIKREETIVEPGVSWGWNEGWSGRAKELIEIGKIEIGKNGKNSKKADGSEWSAERRERIFQQVLARVERARQRRRLLQAFAAGASTVLLVGLLLRLIGVGAPPPARQPELAAQTAIPRLAAE